MALTHVSSRSPAAMLLLLSATFGAHILRAGGEPQVSGDLPASVGTIDGRVIAADGSVARNIQVVALPLPASALGVFGHWTLQPPLGGARNPTIPESIEFRGSSEDLAGTLAMADGPWTIVAGGLQGLIPLDVPQGGLLPVINAARAQLKFGRPMGQVIQFTAKSTDGSRTLRFSGIVVGNDLRLPAPETSLAPRQALGGRGLGNLSNALAPAGSALFTFNRSDQAAKPSPADITPVASGNTDESGGFRLVNLPPGFYYLAAGPLNARSYFPGAVGLAGGKNVNSPVFRLSNNGSNQSPPDVHRKAVISGRILNPDGSPAIGIGVGMASRKPSLAGNGPCMNGKVDVLDLYYAAMTDSAGRFQLEAADPGNYYIVAGRVGGGLSGANDATSWPVYLDRPTFFGDGAAAPVAAGTGATEVEIRLASPPESVQLCAVNGQLLQSAQTLGLLSPRTVRLFTVRGRVTGADFTSGIVTSLTGLAWTKTVVGWARVELMPDRVHPFAMAQHNDEWPLRYALTPDSRFEVRNVPPGTYLVQLSTSDLRITVVDKDLDIDVPIQSTAGRLPRP